MQNRSVPDTMPALKIERYGDLGELRVVDVERPRLREGEALVQILASGINPSDVKNTQGAMKAHTTLPRIVGRDYAGVVVEGPAEWLGKPVWGAGGDLGFTRDGAHAAYMAVPIGSLRPMPANLTPREAGAVGTPYVTAFQAVDRLANVRADETLLVIGGTGAVGTAATQIAKWRDARVIATARKAEHTVQTAADATIVLGDESLEDGVRRLTDGRGVDLVLNVVGGETFEPSLKALRAYGRMVCIAASGDPRVSLNLLDFYRANLTLYGLNTLTMTAVDCAELLEQMAPGFESGALHVEAPEASPLTEAPAAYQRASQGGLGKIVLEP